MIAVDELLRVEQLEKSFPVRSKWLNRPVGRVQAISGVDLVLHRGETLGLVGESGCGKSTTGRCLVGLYKPTAGRIFFDGTPLHTLGGKSLREARRGFQMVFQDPYSSINPRMSVDDIVAEPLRNYGLYPRRSGDGAARVAELLELVGLEASHAKRYPRQLSGGQRQRVSIARALALEPSMLVLDEPVSALDVSIQAQVVSLLEDLQDRLGLAYLFISHDLSVVRHLCDRVAVMYMGKVVEVGATKDVLDHPAHPYTRALRSAVPVPDPARRLERGRIVLAGDVPSPSNPPSGCRFRTRCWKAAPVCADEEPALVQRDGFQQACACFFAGDD